MNIGKKKIGEGQVFIIAEAGANFRISENPAINYRHALKLIDIAVEAKADAVKFQLYRAKKLYVEKAGTADYLGKKKSIYDLIKEMEVPYEWLPRLKLYCDKKHIMFLCTPFDHESADELDAVGVPAFKIASYSITTLPFLRHVAKKKKPIILSTGASGIEDIRKAVSALHAAGNHSIILLQCTAKYPAPLTSVNLKAIIELRNTFHLPVGLSDHSREPLIAPLGAVALGACVVEKHYTTDNTLPGPDHGFAILPHELKQMVASIRSMEQALGSGKKVVLKDEKELHSFARHFMYTKTVIRKGERFSQKNIAFLRPGKAKKGMEPSQFDDIKGKKASRSLKRHEPITEDCVDG